MADGPRGGSLTGGALCHNGPMMDFGNMTGMPPAAAALDGRVKIALLLAYSVALFFVRGPAGLAAAALLLTAVGAWGRVRAATVLRGAAPAYVIAGFLLVYNAAAAGWMAGVLVAGRVLLLVYASMVMVALSTATELTWAIQRLLAPLGKLGLPVRDAACALSIALRFIPVTAQELAAVRAAQTSRGAAFERGGAGERARAWAGLMVPLFVGLFRRADRLAAAMDSRCFGASAAPTTLDERRFRLRDGAVLLAGLALCVGLVLLP